VPYLFKLSILLGGIGVVEPHDERALEGLLVKLVDERSLRVTDVQETARLRREPDNHLPHLRPRQIHKLPSILLDLHMIGNGISISYIVNLNMTEQQDVSCKQNRCFGSMVNLNMTE